jgi:hypothetical protein
MDIASRNQRLYRSLAEMGLYVVPIPAKDDPGRIDYLHVAADLPSYVTEQRGEQAASGAVPSPMPRAQIAEKIRPAEGGRDKVVDLPTPFRRKPVVGAADSAAVAVDSECGPADSVAGSGKDEV